MSEPLEAPADVVKGRKWEVMRAILTAYMKRDPFDPKQGAVPLGGGLWPCVEVAADEILRETP